MNDSFTSNTGSVPQDLQLYFREQGRRMIQLYAGAVQRMHASFLLHPDNEFIGLAAICFVDFVESLQFSGKSLDRATHRWYQARTGDEQEEFAFAVHETRFYVDNAAVCLVYTANHLSSAMWHLEERECRPLGRDYKSATQVYTEWKKRTPAPQCFAVLSSLVESPAWKHVSGYRDHIIHRARPVLEGERKLRRASVWQPSSAPPPAGPHFMKVSAPGKMAYVRAADEPEFRVNDLLGAFSRVLDPVATSGDAFLQIFDARLAACGIGIGTHGLTVSGTDGSVVISSPQVADPPPRP